MTRPSSDRKRIEGIKPTKRAFIVATEDSKTGGYKYFEEFAQSDECYRFLKKYAFRLTVIPSAEGKSAPDHILDNLKNEKLSFEQKRLDFEGSDPDSFWIVCDV